MIKLIFFSKCRVDFIRFVTQKALHLTLIDAEDQNPYSNVAINGTVIHHYSRIKSH